MVVDSIPPVAECRPNDHRKDAPRLLRYFEHSKLKVSQSHQRAYKGSNSTIGFRKTEENLEDVSIEVNINLRSPV